MCFLCGADLADGSHDEHVFPLWLQKRYRIGHLTLTLLNGTTIPYRQLKIPCCQECNNKHLSRIEKKVERAVNEGVTAVRRLDKLTLFLWVAKLFFGILYKELLLPLDRKTRHGRRIVENLKGFELLHYFIQGLRIPMTFQSADNLEFPGTIFVYRVQRPDDVMMQFDFRDDVVRRTVYLRMGEVGILVAFDAGAQAIASSHAFRRPMRRALHPLQLQELAAHLFYDAHRFNRSPMVITAASGPGGRAFVFVGPIKGISNAPVFDESNPDQYAYVLSVFTGIDYSVIRPNREQVMTFLYDLDGTFKRMPIRKTGQPRFK